MTSLDIVFVSAHPRPSRFRQDGSFIYRCENLGLALQALGHRVSFRHLNAMLLTRERYDIAVFLRPPASLRLDWALAQLRRRGTRLVADFDDLVFDPAMAPFRPSVLAGQASEQVTRAKFLRNAQALAKFERVTLSTGELGRHLQAVLPQLPFAIIPNASHRRWRELPKSTEAARVVTYFSGTRTHDRDFALAEPALEQLLRETEDIVLKIVGPVTTRLSHPRLQRVDKVKFEDYPQVVRDSYLNIAPLEDTPFNRCKSALKAIEAGHFSVPTVASPIGDYLRLQVEGILYASSDDEWLQQLRLACEPASHRRLSTGLAERLLPLCDVDAFAAAFLEFAA